MIDDLLSIKAASIGRCVSRAREEYARAQEIFAADLPARDTAILNMLRACEAALHMGNHLIHSERLGAPQSARKVLLIVPTLPRGYAARPLPHMSGERPEFWLPRWCVGAIKKSNFPRAPYRPAKRP